MYSRPHKHSDPPLHLPENYSGCAFSASAETQIQPPPPVPYPTAKESPPPEKKEPPIPHDSIKNDVTSLFSGPLSLLGGLHFEELLLIGLILLLARSDQGSDVILWLALLLFCK